MKKIIGSSKGLLEKFSKNLKSEIGEIEILLNSARTRKKSKHYDNSLMFYNSLSLIMLSLLAGGLVGIIFIIFLSFKNTEKQI